MKDVRIVTYRIWARPHRDGERGLAEGLALLTELMECFSTQLLSSRPADRKAALEWLIGEKMLDSLAHYPEVTRGDFANIVAAPSQLTVSFTAWPGGQHSPSLMPLINALGSCLAQSGEMDAVVPQNSSNVPAPSSPVDASQVQTTTSGHDLIDQAKVLARYLNKQPRGWLSTHRLTKTLRWDAVHELPSDVDSKTRLIPSRTRLRSQLKRLYAQQNWTELLEQADLVFNTGINHFWLNIQWYPYQALTKASAPWDKWTAVIRQDLALLLERLSRLENLAWNNDTPFTDEAMRNWIAQQTMTRKDDTQLTRKAVVLTDGATNDVLALEPEALETVDSQDVEATLDWIQTRPDIIMVRQRLLLQLLMAQVAEQYGKNETAPLLLEELGTATQGLTLTQWEPDLLFEVKARQLKLLRLRVHRYADKALLNRKMEILLGTLVTIDPVRAATLCDTQHKD